MNEFLNKLEKKYWKYAIPNLTIYIIGLYVIGYILNYISVGGSSLLEYLVLNPCLVLKGQVWRLVSWFVVPSGSFGILTIITLMFYYFVGTNMERTLGTFRYNIFILGGVLFVILASFLSMFVYYAFFGVSGDSLVRLMQGLSLSFNFYYIQTTIFMAFALCYPNVQVLLYFVIPVKIKYLGIFYAAMNVIDIVISIIGQNYPEVFVLLLQFVNLGLFYLQTGRANHLKPREVKRRTEYQKHTKIVPPGVTRHKCAVCGRTEQDDPNLEFRFCSKCNGNYEYCQDHLFTHQHIK